MKAARTAMDVKAAVAAAKQYVAELFADEHPTGIRLEEVEKDGSHWNVTVGFYRQESVMSDDPMRMQFAPERDYKVIVIDDAMREVTSVKHRSIRD